ncbi:hypothetical protein BS78_09G091600 [Paspalum vaginatum]|nr:hypothetical protein BS78_09G091600 [Paspalum vaginatum]KAJ1262242.1 hypothetical protein BS78_09G091600 [Paspalum vaginatum]
MVRGDERCSHELLPIGGPSSSRNAEPPGIGTSNPRLLWFTTLLPRCESGLWRHGHCQAPVCAASPSDSNTQASPRPTSWPRRSGRGQATPPPLLTAPATAKVDSNAGHDAAMGDAQDLFDVLPTRAQALSPTTVEN